MSGMMTLPKWFIHPSVDNMNEKGMIRYVFKLIYDRIRTFVSCNCLAFAIYLFFNTYSQMRHHRNMYVGCIHKCPINLGRHGSLQLFNFFSSLLFSSPSFHWSNNIINTQFLSFLPSGCAFINGDISKRWTYKFS